ncbi:MAG: acetylglutamate kinase [Candidatus Anoxymicrobium japonicum]|uniref:Acetylglutamate kinase n=1 Tax=Candidatus Anoxymicrobium japonicum TaxID=2013648 RepID=A0A2N3G8D8_9ACTN|nr:MAG: acetylglutamate kinase [Candidatus Anoxymicrobium japonicum]
MTEDTKIPEKARILTEALPYIKMHRGKTVVIKLGGNAMENRDVQRMFASDVVLMRYVGIQPVIVHGGGAQITEYMKKMSKEVSFVDGHRVTDAETMEIARMVLVGKVNKEIVSRINRHGTLSIGLSGDDCNLIMAHKRFAPDGADIGWVGNVSHINAPILEELLNYELIPVIASIGTDREGNSYNINADIVAGEVATALNAAKIIYMTNVKGIMSWEGELLGKLDTDDCGRMLERGDVSGGMIPKVEGCLKAVDGGVSRAHVIDGTTQHALLLELFTDEGVGTMITTPEEQ